MKHKFNFENRGHSLKNIGVSAYVYNYTDTLLYIDWIQAEELIILGGDVYRLKNNEFEVTYDNWYYPLELDENKEMDSVESIVVTKEYINKYVKRNGKDFYFCLVVVEKSKMV